MSSNNQILYIVSALAASEKAMKYAYPFNNSLDFFEANDQSLYNASLTLLIAIGEEIKKMDKEILSTQSQIQ